QACLPKVRGYREVRPPVAIEVGEADGECERPRLRTRHAVEHDAGGYGGFLEGAGTGLAAIVEQVTDGAGDAGVDRVGLQLGDEEVEIAVAVVVPERRAPADGPAAGGHTPPRRFLAETTMTIVHVQEMTPIGPARHIEVQVAVVVHVTERGATHRKRLAEI